MLRPYQVDMVSEIRKEVKQGRVRLIVQLPTGGGKTIVFSYLATRFISKGARLLIITDRIELLRQSGGALSSFGLDGAIIHGKASDPIPDNPCCLITEQTLRSRLIKEDYKVFLSSFDGVFIDEAHKVSFDKFFPYFDHKTIVIGFTATPVRKGKQVPLLDNYKGLVQGISVLDLIEQKYLCPAWSYHVPVDKTVFKIKAGEYDIVEMEKTFSEPKNYGGIIPNYRKYCNNSVTLVFCPGVASSRLVQNEFLWAGYDCRQLDGSTPKEERKKILEGFGKEFPILVNCDILTTGYDNPLIDTIILYRATTSLTLYLQMIGRGSRIRKGKTRFSILDFGSNIQTHGVYELERQWSLEKAKPKRAKVDLDDIEPYAKCVNCDLFFKRSYVVCPGCGEEVEQTKHDRIVADLALINPFQLRQKVAQYSFEELDLVAKIQGKKAGWVSRVVADRGGISELTKYGKFKRYHQNWAYKKGSLYGIL